MRDLASRLRSIIRQDHGGGDAAPRELTYVADTDGLSLDPARAAETLGGSLLDSGDGACIVIDHVWEAHRSHGRRAVAEFVPSAAAPLSLFDPKAGAVPDWSGRPVFFDLETTGLSGGAGTLPFLAGCAWFEGGALRVRQFFLAGPAGERAMLAALTRVFDDATMLVTYNGRTFDGPLMDTRWAFHRQSSPLDDLPHFDMLPAARRLWSRKEVSEIERTSCTLSSLERSVLGFHRLGDVPGFEIPARYFHFLRTGETRVIEGVLEHNRHDLVSLAGVMAHALSLAADGPDACRDASEQMALGRIYERAGRGDDAVRAYELAARSGDRDVRPHAMARLASLLGRRGRHDEAAAAWEVVLEDGRRRGPLSPLARRAAEALAIHHEHRARNLETARGYAEALHSGTGGRTQRDAAHRLGRLDRKLMAGQPGRRLDWETR